MRAHWSEYEPEGEEHCDERERCEGCGCLSDDVSTVTRVLRDDETGEDYEAPVELCWRCRPVAVVAVIGTPALPEGVEDDVRF